MATAGKKPKNFPKHPISDLIKLGIKEPVTKKALEGTIHKEDFRDDSSSSHKASLFSKQLGTGEIQPQNILKDFNQLDSDSKCEAFLNTIFKQIKHTKQKQEPILYLSFFTIAKERPYLFQSPKQIEIISNFLKKEPFKKPCITQFSFVCNLLLFTLSKSIEWPESLVHHYIEDAMGERIWVDLPSCRKFTHNLLTAFDPKHSEIEELDLTPVGATPSHSQSEFYFPDCSVKLRFNALTLSNIKQHVIQIVNEYITKRQPSVIPKNLILFLKVVCVFQELRCIIAKQLDAWLPNTKLTKPALELLNKLVSYSNLPMDADAISALVTLKLKSKHLNISYVSAIQALIKNQDILKLALREVIHNELLPSNRNPTNFLLFLNMFKQQSAQSTLFLGIHFQDLLANKENYLKALKPFLKELIRQVKFDFDVLSFANSLFKERHEEKFVRMDTTLRERYINSIADLVLWALVMNTTLITKDLNHYYSLEGGKEMKQTIIDYYNNLSSIQLNSLHWIETFVPEFLVHLTVSNTFYPNILYKLILFDLDFIKDDITNEHDRSVIQKCLHEGSPLEDSIMSIARLPAKHDTISSAFVIEILDSILANSLSSRSTSRSYPICSKSQVCNCIFELSLDAFRLAYKFGATNNIEFCMSDAYWKSFLLLLILAATNPKSIGREAFENYPILTMLIEICMTGKSVFPPSLCLLKETREIILTREKALTEQEDEEATKLLKAASEEERKPVKLIIWNPTGPVRKPTQWVIDKIKELNANFGLRKMFFQSRDPDFLLKIIESQGTAGSLKWLSDLLESDFDFSISGLPIVSICELFISGVDEMRTFLYEWQSSSSIKKRKNVSETLNKRQQYISQHLQSLLHDDCENSQQCIEMFIFFFTRISQTLEINDRMSIYSSLSKLFDDTKNNNLSNSCNIDWITYKLPQLPAFNAIRDSSVMLLIIECCRIECRDEILSILIIFIQKFASELIIYSFIGVIVERQNFFLSHPFVMVGSDFLACYQIHSVLLSMLTSFLKSLVSTGFQFNETVMNETTSIYIKTADGEFSIPVKILQALLITLCSNNSQNIDMENSNYGYLLNFCFPTKNPSLLFKQLLEARDVCILNDDLIIALLKTQVTQICEGVCSSLTVDHLLAITNAYGLSNICVEIILLKLEKFYTQNSEMLIELLQSPKYVNNLAKIETFFRLQTSNKSSSKFYSYFAPLSQGIQEQSNLSDVFAYSSSLSPRKLMFKDYLEVLDSKALDQFFLQIFSVRNLQPTNSLFVSQTITLRMISEDLLTAELCNEKHSMHHSNSVSLIVTRLYKLVSSNRSGRTVLDSLFQRSYWSCPIFKMLCVYNRKQGFARDWSELIHLIKQFPNQTGILVPLLQYFILDFVHSSQDRPKDDVNKMVNELLVKASRDVEKSFALADQILAATHETEKLRRLDYTKLAKAINLLNDFQYEKTWKIIWNIQSATIQSNDYQKGYTFLLNLIGQHNENIISLMIVEPLKENAILFKYNLGKYLDTLVSLDPEIGFSKNSQFQKSGFFTYLASYFPYLISAYMSEIDWAQLTDLLLANTINEKEVTSYLNFLTGCLNAARLWQGKLLLNGIRSTWCFGLKKKFNLTLETNTIKMISGYIYTEFRINIDSIADQMGMNRENILQQLSSDSSIKEKFLEILYRRTTLIMILGSDSTTNHKTIANCFLEKKGNIGIYLVTYLYLIWPDLNEILPSIDNIPIEISLWAPSTCDIRLHQLFTKLISIKPSETVQAQTKYVSLIKKIAVSNQILLLRYLPILPSFVSGTSKIFTEENPRQKPVLFSNILSIIKLLQPAIFNNFYYNDFLKLLESYLAFFEPLSKKCTAQESLLESFCEMLLSYLRSNLEMFRKFIDKHFYVLEEIYTRNTKIESLETIVNSFRMTKSNLFNINGRNFGFIYPEDPPDRTVALIPFKMQLSPINTYEVIRSVLKELDDQSLGNKDVLSKFSKCFQILIINNDLCVREKAMVLVCRYLKQHPGDCKNFVSYFLMALNSDNYDVMATTGKHIPEVIMFCEKSDAKILLRCLFVISCKRFQELKAELIICVKNCIADQILA